MANTNKRVLRPIDETKQYSEHSTSAPVGSDENLVRAVVVLKPADYEDGQLKPSYISIGELSEAGFSVDRRNFSNGSTLRKIIDKQLRKRVNNFERIELGLAVFSCQSVRDIRDDDNRQAVAVIDAGLPENKAHAILLAKFETSPSYLRMLRNRILMLLNTRKKFSEVFEA